jgi:tetratricopeptide (TPR) repeat protein
LPNSSLGTLQSYQHVDARFRQLSSDLAAAYVRLGAVYIRDGRFTRALQHFKQGVHLFGGAGAKEAVALCYSCLGMLFIRKALSGGEAQYEWLLERERSCQESLRHYDLALQVRRLLLAICHVSMHLQASLLESRTPQCPVQL